MTALRLTAGDSSVQTIIGLLDEAEARAGATKVLAIDGRSGSGKSTLAAMLSAKTGGVVVHIEDLYPGWHGLQAGVDLLVSSVLEPVAAGRGVFAPQWDWHGQRWGSPLRLAPPWLLIVEGVGAACASVRRRSSLVLWLEVPDEERLRRAQARDWTTYGEHWSTWADQEDRLIAREGLPDGVDVILEDDYWRPPALKQPPKAMSR
jgi:hypothetical protein